jgi:thiol-disulfide isomerase/thioredoxin
MKKLLEGVSTLVTILAGLAVVYLGAERMGWLPAKVRPAVAATNTSGGVTVAEAAGYQAGDDMPDLTGIDYGKFDKTVLVVFRSNCGYCIKSAGFYQELVERRNQRGARVRIIAVAPAADTAAKDFPSMQGWSPDQFAQFPVGTLRTRGVPAIFVVNKSGKVEHASVGLLQDPQKNQVLSAIGL